MSYILDALKKAESERQLGSVPGVHATPQDSSAHADETPFWRRNLPWLLVALLGLCLLAYVLWSQLGAKAPTVPAAPLASVVPEPASTPVVTAAPPPTPASNVEDAPAPAPATPGAVTTTLPKATAVTPPTITPIPKHAADAAQLKAPEKAPAEVNTKVEAKSGASASAPAAAPADAAEQSIGTAQDLPPNIQRELPQISVNGYIYAKNADDRSVLMNRKLLREGDTVAPDLVLEKLLPKGAILNYKGYRYRVAF